MPYREGDIELNFAGALSVDKLDASGRRMPIGMKLVDFVVEESERLLLVEVKDPSQTAAAPQMRADFREKMKDRSLIDATIAPKARDSYCFLHLMSRATKPCFIVFLLGVRNMPREPALILTLQQRLKARIQQEADTPWVRQYATGVVILTEDNWANWFPAYPLVVH